MSRLSKAGIVVLVLCFVWFTAIDKVWIIRRCPTCGYERDDLKVRVLHLEITSKSIEHHSVQQLIARDLHHPCQHPSLRSEVKQRWWGLLLRSSENQNGIERLVSDESWYDETKQESVRNANFDVKANAIRQIVARCDTKQLQRIVADILNENESMVSGKE